MAWRESMAEWMFGDVIAQRVQAALKVVDDRWWAHATAGGGAPADRHWGEQQQDLQDALEAWRVNPLARRIVQLTTDYVVGDGMTVTATASPRLAQFVRQFWDHRQNRLDLRLPAWCDELTRAGELFIVLFPNPADGMSYVRTVPASRIRAVDTDSEDLERERGYWEVNSLPPLSSYGRGGQGGEGHDAPGERYWKGLDHPDLRPDEPVMLHYTINKPVGATRGEGDLGPILVWLRRYRDWLEGRVRVNKYKNLFVWDVTVPDQAIAVTRQKYAVPPREGSVIVHGPEETWSAVTPNIDAGDAAADGKALRSIIGAGVGVPLHFLADPEGSTQTTAQEANEPTYRHFQQRQKSFLWLLEDLLTVAVMRAQALGRLPSRPAVRAAGDLGLRWTVSDLTRRDNLTLARSAQAIVDALAEMKAQGWIGDAEAATMALRFAGELVDREEVERRLGTGD